MTEKQLTRRRTEKERQLERYKQRIIKLEQIKLEDNAIRHLNCLDYIKQRSCKIKIKHKEQRFADAAARKLANKYSGIFNSYSCKFCKGFHVGKSNRPYSGQGATNDKYFNNNATK